jgi:hypothetical protein
MSQEQESVRIYLWGFIESRGHIPQVAEAYGELTEAFALMNSNERAIEMGFSPREAMDLTAVLEGSDQAGPFEIRQFYLESIDLNGTAELFEEANGLAGAAASLLRDPDREELTKETVDRLRLALAAYDERWGIER